VVLHGLLCELSLYLLIYTEASSLRHTPELLWFLYWCMNHSYVMHELWKSGLPLVEEGEWGSSLAWSVCVCVCAYVCVCMCVCVCVCML